MNFSDFWKIFKFQSKFSRKFRWTILKKYGYLGCSGGGDPEASESSKELVEKSMDTEKPWKLTCIFREFWLDKANFNNNYGRFDGHLKIFNNSKRN